MRHTQQCQHAAPLVWACNCLWEPCVSSPSTVTTMSGLSLGPETHLKGHSLMSACTIGSLNLRPISRLASNTWARSKGHGPRANATQKHAAPGLKHLPRGRVLGIPSDLVLGCIANPGTQCIARSSSRWQGEKTLRCFGGSGAQCL